MTVGLHGSNSVQDPREGTVVHDFVRNTPLSRESEDDQCAGGLVRGGAKPDARPAIGRLDLNSATVNRDRIVARRRRRKQPDRGHGFRGCLPD